MITNYKSMEYDDAPPESGSFETTCTIDGSTFDIVTIRGVNLCFHGEIRFFWEYNHYYNVDTIEISEFNADVYETDDIGKLEISVNDAFIDSSPMDCNDTWRTLIGRELCSIAEQIGDWE